ncbi:MAG TPA: ABC transporter ATP-binding protein [Geminicoccus sp.]|uniref:ABC transporter ATP-binding protein n=1 Tax=Geminicoccus sp. TaxID=2024832 RepID=UPI002E33C859|nr:ABC transporter ATP-binding protein [Geminicoccus sp.]HEX2529542.1 ABC transporter ATP-binding protein [Geminicoccus sp.]
MSALSVEQLVAGYEPGLPIVKGASLRVETGEIVAILGPNGAGKSTLIKAVAGLLPVVSGAIRFQGRDMRNVPAHRLIREGLAFVPQTENVFANLTVAENLELAGFFLGRSRSCRLQAMYALFPDLARQRSLLAGRLSGGQRQMLAVARALLVEPAMIMLDEPSAGLSPKLVAQVFEKLAEVRATGITILMVEQNVKAALALADRAYVLVEGRERLEAPAAELRGSRDLAALYLGGAAA